MPKAPADRHAIAAERTAKLLDRLVFFSDAVIAIVITLMVLEVKPPRVQNEGELLDALAKLWEEYLAVGISFLAISVFWVRHHRRFAWISKLDAGLIWLNLIFLLAISAIPFATALLAKYPQRVGTIIYALVVAVAGLLMDMLWVYACRRGLTAPDLSAEERQRGTWAPLAIALVFLASIPIALWSPAAAKFFWLLALPAGRIPRALARSDKRPANAQA